MPGLLLFFMLVAWTPVVAENAPIFVFDGVELVFSEEKNIIDMGRIKQGGASSVSITVKNQSGQVLRKIGRAHV